MLRRGIIHTGKVGIKMKVKPNVCLTFVWWTKIFVRIFGFTVTTTRTHDESSRGDRGVYRNNRRTTTSKQCTKVAVFGWINEHAPKNCMPLRDNTLNFHFKLFHRKKSSLQPSIQRSIATDLKQLQYSFQQLVGKVPFFYTNIFWAGAGFKVYLLLDLILF